MGHRDFELAFELESGFSVARDETLRQHDRRFVLARSLGVWLIGLLLQVLPLGIPLPVRLTLTGVLWLGVIPVGIGAARRLRSTRLGLFHSGSDAAIICVASFLAPPVWQAALVVLAGVLVSAIPTQSRRTIVVLALPSIGAMALAGHLHQIDTWYASILGLLAALPGFDFYYRASRRRADTIRSRYDALVEAAAVFFWELDLETRRFVSVAGNVEQLIGHGPADLLDMRWYDLMPSQEVDRLRAVPVVEAGEELTIAIDLLHRDGRRLPFQHVVRRETGSSIMRGVSSDISDLARATETIRYQAEHDALTGLVNRAILVERLDRAVRSATDDRPAALLMLDLDRFKEVNDALGHPIGDRLLQVLAGRLGDALPEAEVIARLGGDEFAILLTDEVSRASALAAAERVAAAVERTVEIDRVRLSVGPSIGVVLAPRHGTTSDDVLAPRRRGDVRSQAAR